MNHATTAARASGHFHAVRFYETRESLCRMVAEFLGEGMVIGQPALVVATPEHRDGIVAELAARHFDIDKMLASSDLLLLDAREVLSTFMEDGQPDATRFNVSVPAAIDRLRRTRTCTVRAYGEMVDLLWKDGLTTAAVRLEMLWNQLAMTREFSLLCGYAMGNFYKDAAVSEICGQHSHIISPDGSALEAVPPVVN